MTRDTAIHVGDLLDLYDEGELVSAVAVGTDKGRHRVITQAGKELRVTSSRIAHVAGPSHAGEAAARAAAAALRHCEAAVSLLSGMDLPALWDVLADAPRRHDLASLASLALGQDGPEARSAMLRALHEDKVFFVRRLDSFEPRSRGQVEETQQRIEAERSREERRAAFLECARAALRTPAASPAPPPPASRVPADAHRDLVADLVELALMETESPATPGEKDALTLLDDAGAPAGRPAERAFGLLRALGVFKEDENLYIHRLGLKLAFPAEVEAAARRAVEQAAPGPDHGRRDLRSLLVLTVDDEVTREIDDGLSVEPLGAATRVGVHIADPGMYVKCGDPVDREALQRAATWYFPDVRIPMLPPLVSERAASLVAGEDRPALSFMVTLSGLGEVISSEIIPSTIRARARLTYEDADRLLEMPEGEVEALSMPEREQADLLRRLAGLAGLLEQQRVAAGAVIIRAAEVSVRAGPGGAVEIRLVEDRGTARRLVAESMILANAQAAAFLVQRAIPAIFRRQAPPLDDPIAGAAPSAAASGAQGYDPVAVRALRRRMRRGESGLSPGPHAGLGLQAYTQATSPIRRYQDLVLHRQIRAALAGAPPPYDAEALARIAATTEEAEKGARDAERGATEYWILKHYAGRIGETIDGTIVWAEGRRTEVELADTLYTVPLAARPTHRTGARLKLVIEASHPRGRRLMLREMSA